MMSKLKLYLIAIVLTLTVFSSSVLIAAQVYKSTDAQGNVIYSDKPSAGSVPVQVNTAPIGNNQAVQQTQQIIEQQKAEEEQQQKNTVENQQAQQKAKEEERVKELCENSKTNLALLQDTGRRVYTITPDGEYHYFSDKERQQEIERLQEQIKSYCQ